MGPVLEMEAKSNTVMAFSAAEQNNGSVPQDSPNKLVYCASNNDDKGALSDGKAVVQNGSDNVEVDIIECTKSRDHAQADVECQDTTENSSSFSGTISGTENVSTSDVEVESPFCAGNGSASMFDGYSSVLPIRKKKLTDHWRRFIHPVMWRCKWIELQLKQIQSQALKYDIELAKYDKKKQVESEKSTLDSVDAESRPFSSPNLGNQVMKRKKRKRVEEITDLASYMSQHNLFSYYEYKKFNADGAYMENDYGNSDNKVVKGTDGFEFNDGWLSLEFRDGNNSLEQMLSQIEVVQSQVRKLKDRIDRVVSENPGKYTSINRLSLLVPCETSSDRNVATPPENGNGMPDRSLYISPQHASECNRVDLFIPGSTVSIHGEVTPLPDMIESTGQLQVGDSCETNKEAIMIDNQSSDEELHNFRRVITQLTARPQVSTEELNASPPAMTPEVDLPEKTLTPCSQPSTSNTKSKSKSKSSARNNKRKWGRRKSRLGKWRR